MWSAISRLLSEQFGNAEITQRHALAGGDIHPTWQIRYGDHDVFVKSNSRDMLSLFTWEADQLDLLARTGTVRVPEVYGVGHHREESFLLLNISGHSRLMSRVHINWVSSWRICISGASRRSLAWISTITSLRRLNPTAGCAAGRFFLLNSVLAGNCNWRRKRGFSTGIPS